MAPGVGVGRAGPVGAAVAESAAAGFSVAGSCAPGMLDDEQAARPTATTATAATTRTSPSSTFTMVGTQAVGPSCPFGQGPA